MAQNQKKTQNATYINPQETLKQAGGGASGGLNPAELAAMQEQMEAQKPKKFANPDFKPTLVFSKDIHNEEIRTRQELDSILNALQNEVAAIKFQSAQLNSEIEKVDSILLQSKPAKVGIYHVRFYEMLLKHLRQIRAKIGDAKTWLTTSKGKGNKRGSAFAGKKKSRDTYMNEEVSLARSVG